MGEFHRGKLLAGKEEHLGLDTKCQMVARCREEYPPKVGLGYGEATSYLTFLQPRFKF